MLSDDTPPEQRSWPRRLLNRLEVNRAVFYALTLRGWQMVGGAVSVLLMTTHFTPEVQGYYYTFGGLVALQTFFEMGIGVVVAAIASHEWAQLRLDEHGTITGDPAARARLVSLGRLITACYAVICLLFAAIVGSIGVYFFLLEPTIAVSWKAPWIVLVAASSLLLWTVPLIALLEGCDQVATVNHFRLGQAVFANVVVWICIATGANLWTAAAATSARLAWDVYLLGVRYRRFFLAFLSSPSGPRVDWRSEVWPMQWRLALGGILGYFETAFLMPVIFHYHGAKVAGQMGMTWTLVTVLQSAAVAWLQARAPLFGVLVARREYRELDRVFNRLTQVSLLSLAAVCALFEIAVWLLIRSDIWLADRMLPPWPTAVFLLITVCNHLPRCQDVYLRAHKRDPTLPLTTISCIGIGCSTWLLGSLFGPIGAGLGYLAVVILIILPGESYIFRICRSDWHQ